jgi:hypothetical protein
MEVLLRELRADANGNVERHDTEFPGHRIAIGSAPESSVQLLGSGVAATHALLTRAGVGLQLKCSADCKVRIDGSEVDSAVLQIGTAVEIAGNRLVLIAPPTGFDFALEVHTDPNVDSRHFEAAFKTDIEQSWISKRRLSWIALLTVLVIGFAVPLAGALLRDPETPALAGLPSDALWSTGDLASAHTQAAGTQCASCHRELFTRVRDEECRACHRTMTDHVQVDLTKPAATGSASDNRGSTQPERCATCHREHGDHASLNPQSDSGCTTCHADAATRFANLLMADVRAFEPDGHPAFNVRLLLPVQEGGWQMKKVPQAGASERSNLKFSHRQHLDPARVLSVDDSAALKCADCHVLTTDGMQFEPMTMEGTCASCHELGFDPANPERQLPHGKPREAILALQEYFARKYSDPAAAPIERERRRLPGRETQETVCNAGSLACARQSAAAEIEAQFTVRGCITCHEVGDSRDQDVYQRYQVLPVRLSAHFFPAARFDHGAHQIQKDKVGDAACLTCHSASNSEVSTDLMLPTQQHCMECHRTHPARDQVAGQCATCHTYHPHALAGRAMLSGADTGP